MKNSNTILIIIVGILLASNLFFGYMLFFHKSKLGFGKGFQNMQLTEEQINSVKNFFSSTADINEIKNYCDSKKMECFYYCRNINQNHEICSQLMPSRPDSQQTQRLN
jgi:hypothetical protein